MSIISPVYSSWMFVDDCAEAIRRVTESGRMGETYNIGTEFEKANRHLTEMIHAMVNKIMQRYERSARGPLEPIELVVNIRYVVLLSVVACLIALLHAA